MRSHFIRSFFPPPTFLTLRSVGFDVSDQSVKYVELVRSEHGLKLGVYGAANIPSGLISSGKIVDQIKLVSILEKLKKEKNLNYIRVSLPEEQIYSFRQIIPIVPYKEIRNTLELSLEEHIPISASDATFDFKIIGQGEDNLYVQVSAVSTTLVSSYVDIFNEASLVPLSFELEGAALARALVLKGDGGTYLIADFGETRTGVSIISGGIVLFTSTIDIGGYGLTKMIEKSLNISFAEAEIMKRTYGLHKAKDNTDLFSVLINGVSVLRDEINKHLIYWQTHKDEDGKERKQVEKILLSGGNANMNGLSEYLSQSLRMKVELGNPWINVGGYKHGVPPMNARDAVGFATAIGLALGHYEND